MIVLPLQCNDLDYVKATVTTKVTAKAIPSADTVDTASGASRDRVGRTCEHELEDNPALEEGKEPVDDFERTESEEGGEEIPSVDTETDLSLGDYLTEDDIPDYKLREMTERAERKEDVPSP